MNTPNCLFQHDVRKFLLSLAHQATQLAPTAVPPTTAPTPRCSSLRLPRQGHCEWKMSMPQVFLSFDSVLVQAIVPQCYNAIDHYNEVHRTLEERFRAHQPFIAISVWVTGETTTRADRSHTNTVLLRHSGSASYIPLDSIPWGGTHFWTSIE